MATQILHSFIAPEQWLSLLGSVLILLAYGLMVARPRMKRWYLPMSLSGSVALFVVAMIYFNIGLMLLEVAWSVINIWGIWKMVHEPR